MRRKKKPEQSNNQDWMATYADLVTLLLCFFVLLFSFSEVNAQKFQQIMQSFQGSLGIFNNGQPLDEISEVQPQDIADELTSLETVELENFRNLKEYIEMYAQDKKIEKQLVAKIDERGLTIRVLDNIFFDSGKAELKPKAKEIILYIGDMLNTQTFKDKHIKIEGHTDTDIINTKKFPSNWELSVIRATNVLRLLEEEKNITGNRISASGYGPNRPVAPNDTMNNKAKNRRVDIVILKTAFNKFEPVEKER